MYLTTQSGRKIKLPSDEDDARITAAAESDSDARPWTVDELALKQTRRGQPKSTTSKEHLTIAGC